MKMNWFKFISICLLVSAGMAGCRGELPNSEGETLVSYHRSGGVAGLVDHLVIDDNGHCILQRKTLKWEFNLAPDDLEHLRQVFEEANFFTLDSQYLPANIGADRIEYVITYRTLGKEHTVLTMDGAIPDALGPILSQLDRIISDNIK